MSRAIFLSDLHITAPDDPRGRMLLDLLRSWSGTDQLTHLFLLGDIFDMWLADHRYFIDRYREIIGELTRLHTAGVEIHYFEGNHDLHLRKYWARELGFQVHEGPLTTGFQGRVLRLEHGDQMDPDDRGYLFLRWLLRTPVMRFVIHHLPGKLAANIGESASSRSRTYTSETKTISAENAVEKIRTHAAGMHETEPFDLLIAGHVHVRDDHSGTSRNGGFRAVNLGTWLDQPAYFLLDDEVAAFVELDSVDVAQSPPRKERGDQEI